METTLLSYKFYRDMLTNLLNELLLYVRFNCFIRNLPSYPSIFFGEIEN